MYALFWKGKEITLKKTVFDRCQQSPLSGIP